MNFVNPLLISANAPLESEVLSIKCGQPDLFQRKSNLIRMKKGSEVTVTIAPQLPVNMKGSFGEFLSAVDTGGKTVTATTLIINILLS